MASPSLSLNQLLFRRDCFDGDGVLASPSVTGLPCRVPIVAEDSSMSLGWYSATSTSRLPPHSSPSSSLLFSVDGTLPPPLSPPSASDFLEYHVATWLWMYVAPTLLILGACGNLLSLAVLRGCTSFRKSSVGFTLSVLAVVDTGVLCVPLLRQWLVYTTDNAIDLRCVAGSAGCKLHFFLSYFLSQLSSWTVIVVTVERTFFVGLPIIAKVICSRFRVIVTWVTITASLMALNAHFFVIAEYPISVGGPPATPASSAASLDYSDDYYESAVRFHDIFTRNYSTFSAADHDGINTNIPAPFDIANRNTTTLLVDDDGNATFGRSLSLLEHPPPSPPPLQVVSICYVSAEYRKFLNEVWYWIDFAVLSAVPFLVVAVGNCVIGVCVVRAVRFRRRHQHRDSFSAARQLAATPDTAAAAATTAGKRASSGDVGSVGSRDRKSKSDRYSAAVSSSTLMLLSVSVTFLVTTTPNVVYFLKVDSWIAAADSDPDRVAGARSEARVRLLYAVTNLLLYMNNSINFLLYCLTGSRFRRAARDLFSRSGVKRPSTATGQIAQLAVGGGPGSNGPLVGCRRAAAAAMAAARTANDGGRMPACRGYSSATVTD